MRGLEMPCPKCGGQRQRTTSAYCRACLHSVEAAILSDRVESDNGNRTTFDTVLTRFGYTREQLDSP